MTTKYGTNLESIEKPTYITDVELLSALIGCYRCLNQADPIGTNQMVFTSSVKDQRDHVVEHIDAEESLA